MKNLWKNEGFRYLFYCFVGFGILVFAANAIEIKSGYRDQCNAAKAYIGSA